MKFQVSHKPGVIEQIRILHETAKKAGQAKALKRRAAARGASGESVRSPGTNPASVSCPPTQTVAASTWRNSRIVDHSIGSTRARYRARA